ncbi:nicotinate phosphoribosyltransferase [Campylobacter upsaliensis]|nr:nicotinate phosphoribosyltransferase [Campylobacter upsaliensis]EAJ0668981.1 nicotinate phosphoribosyltransferase [Campylobacter upsaliensis]EAJ1699897.1 nicotinate phosphoribosyltransferase [Campylobacter upsaliensis]ECQ8105358.1 nicotinate phosphoribosyltransferase [Campylobacter upsaliensis]EHU6392876.1 nicotinate phosphoribosyltransferase [Campylobacter upsaliensis]
MIFLNSMTKKAIFLKAKLQIILKVVSVLTTFKYHLLCDFYEFTMTQGYLKEGFADRICYFDIFFRKAPDGGAFAIFAGLEDILDFVENLHFDVEDLAFLRQKGFDEDFLKYLEHFKFSGEIYSVKEGAVIFANEPVMVIKARAIEAQLLETFLLCTLNHQSLIATKASRIVRAAKGRAVLEFGARRAHGGEAALKGARAAMIGGCLGTSNTLAAKLYGLKTSGTMAHAWVQMFADEYEAFRAFVKLYPENATLLIDTYDCFLGLENAIRVFKEFGIEKGAVRIDSGNLCELSLKIRKRLDEVGLKECKIIASNSLDEKSIETLLKNGAKIDGFGVGERLITAFSDAIFGCVYKLVAVEIKGEIYPKIKISQDSFKTTIPHFKKLFRVYEGEKALYDELMIYDEVLENLPPNLRREELLGCVFKEGKRLYANKSIETLALFTKAQLSSLDEGLLDAKKAYELRLSPALKSLKKSLSQG